MANQQGNWGVPGTDTGWGGPGTYTGWIQPSVRNTAGLNVNAKQFEPPGLESQPLGLESLSTNMAGLNLDIPPGLNPSNSMAASTYMANPNAYTEEWADTNYFSNNQQWVSEGNHFQQEAMAPGIPDYPTDQSYSLNGYQQQQ